MSVNFILASSQRIIFGPAPVLMAKPGATIAAWVFPVTMEAAGMAIMSYAIGPPPAVNSSPRYSMAITNTGQLIIGARSTDGDTTRTFTGSAAVPTGQWTHVVGTCFYGTSEGATYINGELDSIGAFSGTFAAALTSNTVSKSGALSGNPYGDAPQFNGRLEDVRCYGRALGLSEIQTIYAAMGVDGIVAGLEARYPLTERADGLSVVRVADVSETGLSAPPTNNPLYANTITRDVRKFTRMIR